MTGRALTFVLVAAALLAGALVATRGGREQPAPASLGERGVAVTTALVPRQPLFGDTIRAVVDVVLDPERVDPSSVRIATGFAPWEAIGPPERTRRDVGGATYLRTVVALRCTTGPCLPGGATQALTFTPARVSYRPAAQASGTVRDVVRAEWPLLVVSSRYAAARLDASDPAPFRVDLVSLPAETYRLSPPVLAGGLGVLATLLAAAGAVLLASAWPRTAPAAEPEPAPEASLSPLQQALALLEESARVEGASERRRALELVAEELEQWGDEELSGTAKALAWSPAPPPPARTAELAARVRAELESELLARAERERNGSGDAS
ncbi:MAG: hypothetical protein KatS3mg012_1347 [Gaiellaceae bacterium]|nr:MAG: hypothetical protein KatS3mg012_1347 [Gaiellaceae bacterium]